MTGRNLGFVYSCTPGRRQVDGDGGSLLIDRLPAYRTRVQVSGRPSSTFVAGAARDAARGDAADSVLFAEPDGPDERELLTLAGFTPEDDEGRVLVLLDRPVERPHVDHVSIRVVSIDRSIKFYGLLGFRPVRKFLTSGVRAVWLSAPHGLIELIEVPSDEALDPLDLWGEAYRRGLYHVSLDVTALCTSLPAYLARVEAASIAQYGLRLNMLRGPQQQMLFDLVAEVAFLADPDKTVLELVRREKVLDTLTIPDW